MDFLCFEKKIFFEKMEIDNFIIMMNMIVIEKIIVIINNNNSLWALANYVLLYSKKRIIIIGIPRDPLLFFLLLLSNTKQSKAKGDTMPEGLSGFCAISNRPEGLLMPIDGPTIPVMESSSPSPTSNRQIVK